MEHAPHAALINPGAFVLPPRIRSTLIVFCGLGVGAMFAGLQVNPERAWVSLLHNHFYFMSLALGGAFFSALQTVTSSMWSAPVRRLSESFTAYLPVVLVSFLVIAYGIPHLYSWSHAEHVHGDLVLEHKSGYFGLSFFIMRNVVAILLWIGLSLRLVRNSLAQDSALEAGGGDYRFTLRSKAIAPIFIILFGLSFTMVSFDQIMSLDPHWFSTIFGVYCFSGLFYSVLAATALLTLYLRARGPLVSFVNEHHLHDLGKLLFAFTVFWAYIAFSQFVLIWYANLPEETSFYLKRMHEHWLGMSFILIALKFVVPFFSLLTRGAKRNPRTLVSVGIVMLLAHWLDIMWLVQPEFFQDGPILGWIEVGITAGFLGVFGLVVARFLAKHSVVAFGDPPTPGIGAPPPSIAVFLLLASGWIEYEGFLRYVL